MLAEIEIPKVIWQTILGIASSGDYLAGRSCLKHLAVELLTPSELVASSLDVHGGCQHQKPSGCGIVVEILQYHTYHLADSNVHNPTDAASAIYKMGILFAVLSLLYMAMVFFILHLLITLQQPKVDFLYTN